MRSSNKRSPGFTMIEMTVSLVCLTIMLGGVVLATQRGLGLFRQTTANNDIETRAARAMNRIVRELLSADGTTLDPIPDTTFGSSTIDYRLALNWAAGTIVQGPLRQIAWEMAPGELDNGLDDNGNGSIDEGSVVRIENPGTAGERRVVLVNGVSEFLEGETLNAADDNGNFLTDEAGFTLAMTGDSLTIHLSVERLGPSGDLIVRTQQTTITFRNGRLAP